MIYRIYTAVNEADTSRDPDQWSYKELGATHDLDKAKVAAMRYIKENFFHKDTQLYEYEGGEFRAIDFCSYGATLIIEPMQEL